MSEMSGATSEQEYVRGRRWIAFAGIKRIGSMALMGVLWLFLISMAFHVLTALDRAPLWSRLYSACVDGLPDADRVIEIFGRRGNCAKAAASGAMKSKSDRRAEEKLPLATNEVGGVKWKEWRK